MQAEKEIHASQLWQQGLNDVILKSCDTIVLKTLPFNVKFFRWWVRKHETIDRNLVEFFCSVFSHIRTEYEDSVFSPNVGKYGPEKNSVFGHFSCGADEWETQKCRKFLYFR